MFPRPGRVFSSSPIFTSLTPITKMNALIDFLKTPEFLFLSRDVAISTGSLLVVRTCDVYNFSVLPCIHARPSVFTSTDKWDSLDLQSTVLKNLGDSIKTFRRHSNNSKCAGGCVFTRSQFCISFGMERAVRQYFQGVAVFEHGR